ncbi:MAG: hypothetical protein ABL908_06350 [Hyphomicrobium sp.]
MYEYFASLLSQPTFEVTLAALGAAAVAYHLSTVLSTWVVGVAIFPGLAFGALATIDLAKHLGLVIGRDKDVAIIGACVMGLIAAMFVYYMLFNLLVWLTSYNRRAHRELIERAGDQH